MPRQGVRSGCRQNRSIRRPCSIFAMSMRTAIILTALLVAPSCAPRNDADRMLHQWFGISAGHGAGNVRAQLLALFPPGTPQDSVITRLTAARVEPLSQLPNGRGVFVRTGNPGKRVVFSEYAITFLFGPDKLLTDIAVEQWATGP